MDTGHKNAVRENRYEQEKTLENPSEEMGYFCLSITISVFSQYPKDLESELFLES